MSIKPFHFFVRGPPMTSHLTESTSIFYLWLNRPIYPTTPAPPTDSHCISQSSRHHFTPSSRSYLLLHNVAFGLGPLHLPFFLFLLPFLLDTHKASNVIYFRSYPNNTAWHNCIKYGNCIRKTHSCILSFTYTLTIFHCWQFWSPNMCRFLYTNQFSVTPAGGPTV